MNKDLQRKLRVSLFVVGAMCSMLSAVGCLSSRPQVLPGSYWNKADFRPGRLHPVMVVPGKFTVFQLVVQPSSTASSLSSKFYDTVYLRIPERINQGGSFEESFSKGTAYYHCYSSFADWKVDRSKPSTISLSVTSVQNGCITAEVETNFSVINPRQSRQFLEKSRRDIKFKGTFVFNRKNITNLPDLTF